MTAAQRLLGTVRILHGWVWQRGQWYGPVLLEQHLEGDRESYAYDPKAGVWYCPSRWREHCPKQAG
jgi:hypothetical protein